MIDSGAPLIADPELGVPAVTAALADARAWAGNPSYAAIARAIEQARRNRGLTPEQARINRATVYDCFRSGRTRLDSRLVLDIAAALGITGADLAHWRHAVRRSLASESGRSPVTVTVGLPAQREHPVGRDALVEALVQRLETGRQAVALEGMAGVGKTTIATAVAAQLLRRDAARTVVRIDLHAYAPQASAPDPDVALEALLRAAWPDEPTVLPAERVAAYRTRAARSKLVLIIDNVPSAAAVQALLPRAGDAQVLLTSRSQLRGLPGLTAVTLDGLDEADAVDLLARISGRGADAGLATLSALVGHLPLAVHLVGRRLAERPEWTIADHIAALREQSMRLQLADTMQAAIALTYDGLDGGVRQALRLLSGHPGPSLTRAQAAALLDVAPAEAARTIARLEHCYLLRPVGADRWRFHDLVATFARARSVDLDPPTTRRAATTRLHEHLLSMTFSAVALTHPHALRDLAGWTPTVSSTVTDLASARAWLDTERPTLLQAAAPAAREGDPALVIRLAALLAPYLWERGDVEASLALHRSARTAAAELGDPATEAMIERLIGSTLVRMARFAQARAPLERALTISLQLGSTHDESAARNALAMVASAAGDHTGALDQLDRVVELAAAEDPPTERLAVSLSNIAVAHTRAGNLDQARELLFRSARIAADHGWRSNEQWALNNLAHLLVDAGEISAAADAAERALALADELDDDIGVAYARSTLAEVRGAQQRSDEGVQLGEDALADAVRLAAPDLAASVLNHLGALHAGRGEPSRARERFRAARDLATTIGETNEIDRAEAGLASLGEPVTRRPP